MSERHEKASVTLFVVYFIVVLLVSGLSLFAGRALEDTQNLYKFLFYTVTAIGLGLWIVYDTYALKGDNKMFSFLHNPDASVVNKIGRLRWRWINNPLKLLFLSILVFVPIYLIGIISAQKTFFVGYVQYQIAESANLFLAIEPAVIAETLLLLVVMGFIMNLAYNFSNAGRNVFIYFVGALLASSAGAYFMYLYHTFRYGGLEFELASVFVFFLVSALLILLTGSIIPALVVHYLNNGIGMASQLFSSDATIAILFVTYLIFVGLFVSYVFYSKKESAGDRFWIGKT